MKQTIVLFFLFLFAISCQEEIEPNFSFTNKQEEITIDGNEKAEVTFSFSSSREWEATTTSDWLNISPTSGDAGSHQITLTATSENTTGTTRTATVLLSSLSLTKSRLNNRPPILWNLSKQLIRYRQPVIY